MRFRSFMAGAAITALLAFAPGAMAQQSGTSPSQGSTTGPAAGSNVTPSTATQKQNSTTGSQTSGQAAGGAVGAGAPGVTAKQGTEGGPSPKTGTTGSK